MTPAEKLVRSVWLVEASVPYEGSYIVGVYADEAMANRKKEKIEAGQRRYDREFRRWDKATEGLSNDDEWPEDPKMPDHYRCDIEVVKFRLIPAQNSV